MVVEKNYILLYYSVINECSKHNIQCIRLCGGGGQLEGDVEWVNNNPQELRVGRSVWKQGLKDCHSCIFIFWTFSFYMGWEEGGRERSEIAEICETCKSKSYNNTWFKIFFTQLSYSRGIMHALEFYLNTNYQELAQLRFEPGATHAHQNMMLMP